MGLRVQVITAVIDQCEGDLNEALEKLTELSLTSNSSEQCGECSLQTWRVLLRRFEDCLAATRLASQRPQPCVFPVQHAYPLEVVERLSALL